MRQFPLVIDHWDLVIHWLLVIGHWSLVIGHWSLVIGHWSLVIGHWSSVIAHSHSRVGTIKVQLLHSRLPDALDRAQDASRLATHGKALMVLHGRPGGGSLCGDADAELAEY